MEMYKKVARMKLRFNTNKGTLSVEQLWDLKLPDLADAIKETKKVISESSNDDELSFLGDTTVNPEQQLTFDVLKDVYLTKKEEMKEIQEAAAIKAHNQKIMAIISDKEEEELKNLSKEELQERLQK